MATTESNKLSNDPVRAGGKHPFEYQPPSPEQVERIKRVRAAFKETFEVLMAEVPPNRERSVAITNLQQASMWASAAIVFAE